MTDTTNAKADDTPDGAANNTDTAKAAGAGTQTAKTEDADKKFTQADLDRIAAKTREEEKAKAKRDAEEAERKRKEEEAKKQGEFEQLYAELKPRHEAQTERFAKYEATVKGLAEAELKALPDAVRNMAPPLDDPLAVLAWLPNAKTLAQQLSGQPGKPGAGHDPKAKNGGDPKADEKAKEQMRARIRF